MAVHACMCVRRAPNRAADRSAPSKRRRARARRVVMCTCCSDRPTGQCPRVRTYVLSCPIHACMLRAGQQAAAARAARRGTRPSGTHGLATAYDGIDDMHGHWPEHSCWDLRLCDCVSAYWSDSVDIDHQGIFLSLHQLSACLVREKCEIWLL